MAPGVRIADGLAKQIIDLYQAGYSYQRIALELGVSIMSAHRHVRLAGVPRRTKSEALRLAAQDRHADIREAVIARYRAGESEKALAEAFGVARPVIERLLRIAGVERRGRSEANSVRMASMTPAARAALTAPARVNCLPWGSPPIVEAAARTRERRLMSCGLWEAELAAMLEGEGIVVRRQVAVGRYNLDLAVGDLAIEVHRDRGGPFSKHRRRMAALSALGWRLCYVWIFPYATLTAEGCRAVAETVRGPRIPLVVVRGDGRLVHSGPVTE